MTYAEHVRHRGRLVAQGMRLRNTPLLDAVSVVLALLVIGLTTFVIGGMQ